MAATLAVLVDDTSENKAETRAFLGRRLQDVARFEKAKAQLFRSDAEHFSLVRLLGRLRYPAR
jgi:ubiquinone biosynthesis protein COQ9